MWGGVAGLFISIFAIIILYLTRKNILDILDKDVILFGRNFEIKKKTITDAFQIIDEIAETNGRVKNNPNFVERAKMCYNDLLCVISDIRVADEFYSLALEDVDFSLTRIAQFKIMCRKDIGLKTKNVKAVKRVMQNSEKEVNIPKILSIILIVIIVITIIFCLISNNSKKKKEKAEKPADIIVEKQDDETQK